MTQARLDTSTRMSKRHKAAAGDRSRVYPYIQMKWTQKWGSKT